MKNISRIIAVNLIVFILLIVGIEILSQLAFAIKHGKFFLYKDTHKKIFEIHPYLAGDLKSSVKVTQDEKTITTTSYHTRWTGAASEDSNLIRVAILGGSTAFGTGVTDEDSWPALLQKKLGEKYAVINYGVPGYSTAEAIIQMALIVPEKQPRIVIFYEGWNDIRNYHEQNLRADYYGHGIRQYGNLGIKEKNIFQKIANYSAANRLIKSVMIKYFNNSSDNGEISGSPDPFVDRIYVRNLKTLKYLSEKERNFAIFIPQIINYEKFKNEIGSNGWSRHIRSKSMPILMDRFNLYMNDACSADEYNCIVLNEILKEKWLSSDFVDNGHLSRNGGIKFSKIVARYIHNRFDSK